MPLLTIIVLQDIERRCIEGKNTFVNIVYLELDELGHVLMAAGIFE